ncbi:NAD(P)-binding protein [uncultured Cytophaga sp.]|uniref:protoporphyrinogen/coproporphyrinogen oxidase n=1 Tax=uncultured Cytophaga sp. TaxID=160238 RepID=UPI002634AA75|nr:NAD(P)-binding protein [uncultured Cytophaga sp.]
MKNKLAIIGAGISGITAGAILKDTHDVTVFEAHASIGGLVHCDRADGYLYHRIGGHVFNSKNQEVLNWFWSKFNKEEEFIQAKRNAKIFFQNTFIGYPIENFLYQLDPEIVERIIGELIYINAKGQVNPMEYPHFEAFLLGNFGPTLYEIYFKPYNHKIWKTDLATVSMAWLDGKLPMPNLTELITHNITRNEEGNMVHSSFFYPKNGGSQFIADRLAEGLNIQCSTPIQSIVTNKAGVEINGEQFDTLIYTGDVRRLSSILKKETGEHHSINEKLTMLRSNGTSSVLCSCDANDLSWLYIPEEKFKAHRIIYTGNFSNTNNIDQPNRSSCTVEFSGICTYEEMKAELKLLPGNLIPIAYNNEPNSYVIQDSNTRTLLQEYKTYLRPFNIYLLGRFAEWEYYNMDKAMEAAFLLKDKLSV